MRSLIVILALGSCLGLIGCGGASLSRSSVKPVPPPAGGEVTPNYFSPSFQTPYKAFMQQVVQHYGSNPSVGYIRFGLAQGGETYPNLGFDTDATCSDAFTGWGWTPTTWVDYLTMMLGYEETLKSPAKLMVGLNTVNLDTGIPDQVAAYAVSQHIGFGSQGLQQSDISNFDSGAPCTADWCSLFDTYHGQVTPLELQTATQSDPSGGGVTGSLVTLLPFAVENHATSLELYYEDWLTAFDPSYPGYTASYATAIQSAAQGAQMQVVFPPIAGSDADSIQTYVMNNQAAPATGAVMLIQWAAVDQGPSANPQYVWTSVDSAIQPWVAAGKKVNLVVWPVADSATNTATPAYVLNSLGSTNTTTCNNGSGQ